MTSLCPGSVFSTVGFNRKSTPTPPTITPAELEQKYSRQPFNGRPWPARSPVSGVYDVKNSSTQLILLNNQQRRRSKLRGQNDPNQEDDRYPDPNRHSRSSTPVNRDLHHKCYNSQSPYYEPPGYDPQLDWNNCRERPPIRFDDGSAVNPRRHTSCLVPSDPKAFKVGMAYHRSAQRPFFPRSFRSDPLLVHPELTAGEKRYLSSIARIYSADHMKKLKQFQYNQLLLHEMEKGFYTMKEYEQYRRFIDAGRKRQYLEIRAMSAPPQTRSAPSRQLKTSATPMRTDVKSAGPEKTRRPYSVKSTKSTVTVSSSGRSSVKGDKSGKSTTDDTKLESDASVTSDSDNVPEERHHIHKEGVDRPKSRLGHTPRSDSKKSKISTERNNSPYAKKTKKKDTQNKNRQDNSETSNTDTHDTSNTQSKENDMKNNTTSSDMTPHNKEKKDDTREEHERVDVDTDENDKRSHDIKEKLNIDTHDTTKDNALKSENSEQHDTHDINNYLDKNDTDAKTNDKDASDDEPTTESSQYKTDTFTSESQNSQSKSQDKTSSSYKTDTFTGETQTSESKSENKTLSSQKTDTVTSETRSQEKTSSSHKTITFTSDAHSSQTKPHEQTTSSQEHTATQQEHTSSSLDKQSSQEHTATQQEHTSSSIDKSSSQEHTATQQEHTSSSLDKPSSKHHELSSSEEPSDDSQTHTYTSTFEDYSPSSQDRTYSSQKHTSSETYSQKITSSEEKQNQPDTIKSPEHSCSIDNKGQSSGSVVMVTDTKTESERQDNVTRRDSLDDEIDVVRRVNKDVDAIEY